MSDRKNGEETAAGADSVLVEVCVLPMVATSEPQTLRGMSAPAAKRPLWKIVATPWDSHQKFSQVDHACRSRLCKNALMSAADSRLKEIDMLCPFCSHQIAPVWQDLYTLTDFQGKRLPAFANDLRSDLPTVDRFVRVKLNWARCPNDDCHEILVTVERVLSYLSHPIDPRVWYAVPKKQATRPIDALVSNLQLGKDFEEASAILDDSPRMSAVLSRRILADLLKQYAGLNDYNLAGRIDKFIADRQHPSRLRDNLHYLREMGDFGAHTMEDDQGHIVNVEREEAEWTLQMVEDLFDYFIVAPEKDKALRESFDKKLEQAGRKPIKRPNIP